MLSLLVYVLPFILGLVIAAALLGLYANYQRVRQAPYFRIRRDATHAAWRWIFIMLGSAGAIAAALYARQYVPPPSVALLPTLPSVPVAPTGSATLPLPLSITPDGSVTPKDPRMGPPTITPTQPTPTITPTPFISTVESAVTPPAGASLTITAISSGISADLRPVSAGDEFPVGLPRLYMWLEFENMADGVSWSRVLIRNNTVIRSESEVWGRGEEGIAYYYFDAQGGWPSGSYEVQFYVGDKMVASKAFSIID